MKGIQNVFCLFWMKVIISGITFFPLYFSKKITKAQRVSSEEQKRYFCLSSQMLPHLTSVKSSLSKVKNAICPPWSEQNRRVETSTESGNGCEFDSEKLDRNINRTFPSAKLAHCKCFFANAIVCVFTNTHVFLLVVVRWFPVWFRGFEAWSCVHFFVCSFWSWNNK